MERDPNRGLDTRFDGSLGSRPACAPADAGEALARAARRLEPGDSAYPAALGTLDRPPRLWVAGEIPARCVAIVGARRADLGGLRVARALGRDLALAGLAVVSGGAVGIDAAALQGALDAGGRAVVVLGSGIARPYPRESGPTFVRAASSGAVVSPFPPEAEPLPGQFVRRNRIVAALGEAVVVVRAASRSGALSTAEWAVRLGRPLLAVPGTPGCEATEGSNDLLRRGFRPAIDAGDVRAAIGDGVAGGPRRRCAESKPRADADEESVRQLLSGGEAAFPDDLAAGAGIPAARVAAAIGRLEAEGTIVRQSDGRVAAARGTE